MIKILCLQVNILIIHCKFYMHVHNEQKNRICIKKDPTSHVKTCRVYLLTIDLGIVKCIKKFIEQFFEQCEICRHGPNYVQKL